MYIHSFKSVSRNPSKPKLKVKPKLPQLDPNSLIEELKANIKSSLNEPDLDILDSLSHLKTPRPIDCVDCHTDKIKEIKIRRSQSVDALRLKKKINFDDTTRQIHLKTLPTIEEVPLQRCNSTTTTVTNHPIKSPRPLSRQPAITAPSRPRKESLNTTPQPKPKATHAYLKKGSGCVQ